jgi:hypothetical protein
VPCPYHGHRHHGRRHSDHCASKTVPTFHCPDDHGPVKQSEEVLDRYANRLATYYTVRLRGNAEQFTVNSNTRDGLVLRQGAVREEALDLSCGPKLVSSWVPATMHSHIRGKTHDFSDNGSPVCRIVLYDTVFARRSSRHPFRTASGHHVMALSCRSGSPASKRDATYI